MHTYSTSIYSALTRPGTVLGSAYLIERLFSVSLSYFLQLLSEAWAAFCSGQSFLGCSYSEQPWKMETVPPEQKAGTLLPINQDSGSLSSGFLFWNSTHLMGKHLLGHLSCSLGQGGQKQICWCPCLYCAVSDKASLPDQEVHVFCQHSWKRHRLTC